MLSIPSMQMLKSARGTPGYTDASIDRPREMNRYMGGHRRFNHPYISGYWYFIIEPPHRIFSAEEEQEVHSDLAGIEGGSTGRGQSGAISAAPFEATRWLHSTAEGFTPPSRTLTKVDIPGLGGLGSSYIAGQELTRTFSVTFREYQDTPVMNVLNLWTSTIDPNYGVSPLKGNEYIPANYKGAAWIFLCKPTASGNNAETLSKKDVEQFYFFEGVFPEGAPYDGFNSDIATNDTIQLNTTFSFDGFPYGKEHETAFELGLKKLNITYQLSFDGTHEGHMASSAPVYTQDTVAGFSDSGTGSDN